MWKKILVAVAVLVLLVVVGVGALLVTAHRQIDSLAPELPDLDALFAAAPGETDLPVRLAWINTASQPMPRSAVLEPSLDPTSDETYVMSHPSFVLEWADGRRFLFDVGMTPEQAEAFGRPIESVMGAEPMQPIASAAEQLESDVASIRGIAFSHLHEDHVGGLSALCAATGHPVTVFQRPLQRDEANYTTWKGVDMLADADCAEVATVAEDGRIEGFPGLRLVSVAGHTPGSQVLAARVRDGNAFVTWIFTGDAVNNVAGIRRNLPKPRFYSRYVVPENAEQLDRVRRWLAAAAEGGARLAVNHDQLQLEGSGLAEWR